MALDNIKQELLFLKSKTSKKILLPKYNFKENLHTNWELDIHCKICGIRLGFRQLTEVNQEDIIICRSCYYAHIEPINISTIKSLSYDTELDEVIYNNKIDLNWFEKMDVSPAEFTDWLQNLPFLNHEFFRFSIIEKDGIMGTQTIKYHVPQNINELAVEYWLNENKITKDNWIFRDIDTFKDRKIKQDNLLVIYKNQDDPDLKEHIYSDSYGIVSETYLLGEHILGDIIIIHKSIL